MANGKRGHAGGDAIEMRRNTREHRFRQVDGDDLRGGETLLDDAREAALAAADIGDALAGRASPR